MVIQRRLLHCSRCLRAETTNAFNLPYPSQPDPLSPPNPSIASNLPRISLSASTVRKVPARQWNRNDNASKTTNPLARDGLKREQVTEQHRNGPIKLWRDPAKEKLKQGLRQGSTTAPPVAAPRMSPYMSFVVILDAVHCVISPVPKSFTASDVKRLVPYDRTKHTTHPLVEGISLHLCHILMV